MKVTFEQMLLQLRNHNERPGLYEAGTANIWTDPHLSKGMLAAHLDNTTDAASFRPEKRRALLDFLDAQCPPDAYPAMLDIGCGPGLVAEAAASRGRRVTSIDFSSRSIAYARKTAAENNLPIRYIEGDYLKADFADAHGDGYDLAIMVSHDLTVLTPAQRALLLHRVFNSLRPGGVLLVDVFTTHRHIAPEGTKWAAGSGGYWSEGDYLLLNRQWHYAGATYCTQHILLDTDGLQLFNVWEHLFTPDELRAELETAGFSASTFYADHTGAKMTESSAEIYALARK